MTGRRPAGLAFALALVASPLHAQQFDLTIENIMRGPELVGQAPAGVQWSDDGQTIFFRWVPGGQPWDTRPTLYRVSARGGEPQKLTDAQADSVSVLLANGPLSPDRKWRAVTSGGDLYLIDRSTLAVRRLTHTRSNEGSPVFRKDGRAIYYESDNNLFEFEIDRGGLRQVTDFRQGPAPSDPRQPQGQRKFLVDQQKELFEYIREQVARQEEARDERKEREADESLKPIWLERDERITDFEIEPQGRYAVVTTAKPSSDQRRVTVPFWVTESGYTETREIRTKVGDEQGSSGRFAVVSLAGDEPHWIDLAAATDPSNPDASKRELAGVSFIGWNDAGTEGLVASSSADFKDAWLWSMEAATGKLTMLHHLHDDAWVAGPCSFWFRCSGWIPNSRTAWFTSETDGFNHLYTVSADGSGLKQLTSGSWEVHSVDIAPARDRFYLETNEGSPFEVHFYQMNLDGSNRIRITTMPGRQDATPSPDGSRIAFVHSYSNVPPELYVADNKPGAKATRITTTPTADWRSFDWIAPEIIWITASDGVKVPARIYKPEQMGATQNGAAVIFVHGAGYTQNVHNWWASYFREYMFHHVLAKRGYVVLDIDYRGSAGYGRDWRTAIYRHMGGRDLADQVDGSKYLHDTFGIDPERVGIYGGSYGGFITLMALFTAPKSFGAGAGLRSVTDWAHYNHGYTGRILNLPQDDSIAYQQSSPIYFADGLEDPLLMAHGMVDTNVHFSDIVRLSQRLIELGKRNWQLAVYPVEDHGFVVPSSWTDEYRRILELFERNLNPRGDPDSVK
jgi:dipeptidyl aminopeptidase/acylaminoacyl peptidase